MPCQICHVIKRTEPAENLPEDFKLQEATRVVSWETPSSPMVPVCDNHAFAFASETFPAYTNMRIDALDDAINVGEIYNDEVS